MCMVHGLINHDALVDGGRSWMKEEVCSSGIGSVCMQHRGKSSNTDMVAKSLLVSTVYSDIECEISSQSV